MDHWTWKDGEASRNAERLAAVEKERDELLGALGAAEKRVQRLEAKLLEYASRSETKDEISSGPAYDSALQDVISLCTEAMDMYRHMDVHERGVCHAGDREDTLFLLARQIRKLFRNEGGE